MASRRKRRPSSAGETLEGLQYWVPVCLAGVGLALAIALQSFFYLPAVLQFSAFVWAIVGLWTHGTRGQKALVVAITMVAATLATFLLVVPWWRDRDLRAFWSDFRRAGGQVGAGGSVVHALDGCLCWDYIGAQDLQAMAEIQAELLRMGSEPDVWTTSEQYSEAELDEGYACYGTEDFRIGYRAFLDKVAPKFEGR